MKQLLDVYLNLINFWCQHHLRWLPQLTDLTKQGNDNNSVIFKDIVLKFCVEEAECHLQHIPVLQMLLIAQSLCLNL